MAHPHALEFEERSTDSRPSHFAELAPSHVNRRGSLDYFAEQVQALGTGNSPEQMLRLGELVHRLLKSSDGSEGDQRASLRRIAAHPGVPFKVTTIWRAVSVYEMSLRLPHLLGVSGLGISHLRAVIGLDPADQEHLLTQASRERWTKRRLEREAAKYREGRQRRGRRPTPKLTLWTREVQRLLQREAELDLTADGLNAEQLAELSTVLDGLETAVQRLRQRVAEASNG